MDQLYEIKPSQILTENNRPLSEWMQFGLSVDCVIFGYHEGKLKVLLIQRGAEPYYLQWAIPGDLVHPEEDLNASSLRILKHLTGLENIFVEQFGTFGQPNRHPSGRVVTVGYFALVETDHYLPMASHWAADIRWVDLDQVPCLAFDHNHILEAAADALRKKVRTEPVGFNLLPPKFTLRQLQGVYESILREEFDKPNFRKKILASKVLIPLAEFEQKVAYRPARLYCFDIDRYESLKRNKFSFTV